MSALLISLVLPEIDRRPALEVSEEMLAQAVDRTAVAAIDLLKAGKSVRAVAAETGMHRSSVGRLRLVVKALAARTGAAFPLATVSTQAETVGTVPS